MNGISDINQLLTNMSPELKPGNYVFCHVSGSAQEHVHLNPLAFFVEEEGLTLVLPLEKANEQALKYDGVFKQITLTVHSSLQAVGLTAAVANKLTEHNISANVIAAYYHDHIFVPSDKAELALAALATFK